MTIHDATEQAYKNGYEQGKRDAMKDIPKAVTTLIALACCSSPELSCSECPFYNADGLCRSWTEEELVEAVRMFKPKEDA